MHASSIIHVTFSLHHHVIDVAVTPAFARLERAYDGVLCAMEMFGRMLILGRVAAANVSADEALT